MKKSEVLSIVSQGCNPIVRTVMTDGRYFGEKINDDYTVLQKSGDSWAAVNALSEAKKQEPVIILNNCKDAKTGTQRTISVNEEFMGWSLGTGFSFTVSKGKTSLNLQQFSAKQLKELIKDSAN